MTENGVAKRTPLFALVSVGVALALTLLPELRHDELEVAVAAIPGAGAIAISLLWRRRPALAQTGVALAYLVFAAILRDSAGGSSSGFRDLLLLPVVWLALAAGPIELLVGLAGLVAAQVVPLIVIGAPRYPAANWQAVVVQTAVGAVAGYAIHRLTNDARANAVEAATNARKLIELKDEFVAFVAHELRTPLTSMIGYLELLAEESASTLPLSSAQHLEVAQRNAARLTRIIDDLLMVASLDSGKLTLDRVTLDLTHVIRESIERARPAAKAKGIVVATTVPRSLSLVGDRMRLGQVVDNLLSNAVKFTPDYGRVEIEASGDDRSVTLVVRDTGIGIADDELPNLFGQFYRASTAKSHGIPGTGLGLAITDSIVRAHDGSVGAMSTPGLGTTFTVRLPVGREKAPEAEPASAPQATSLVFE